MTETKWYARLVYVLVSLALVLGFSLVPATTSIVSAAGATGKFTIGPPVVTVTFAPVSVNPLDTGNDVSVAVDNTGRPLSNLTDIVFKFWYDSTGTANSKGDFDGVSGDVNNALVITWFEANDTFVLVGPTATTWALGVCTSPANLSETTGTFYFVFDIGKVAHETTGLAIWQIAALATDAACGFDFDADDEGTAMTFYNEVSIAPAATVDWGTVPAGLAFGEGAPSEEALGATVTYIANGDYDEKVDSDDWNGVSHTATLDVTGICNDPQEFALKAAVNGTLPGDGLVTKTPGTTINITPGTITGEAGIDETANTLWLKLASTFNPDVYNGTITYSAV